MAKRKGLLTTEELEKWFDEEGKEITLLRATEKAIEKYMRLLKYWDCQTARELRNDYTGADTCPLCLFLLLRGCEKCPLWCGGIGCEENSLWKKMSRSLRGGHKAQARKYAKEVLRILKEKAKGMKEA